MYEAQGAGAAPGGEGADAGAAQGGNASGGDDDIIDADYEVKN